MILFVSNSKLSFAEYKAPRSFVGPVGKRVSVGRSTVPSITAAPLFSVSKTFVPNSSPSKSGFSSGYNVASITTPVVTAKSLAAPALKPSEVPALATPLKVEGQAGSNAAVSRSVPTSLQKAFVSGLSAVSDTLSGWFDGVLNFLKATVGMTVNNTARQLSRVSADLATNASNVWQAAQNAEAQALGVVGDNLTRAKATLMNALPGQASANPTPQAV